jgi:proline iminopeptidase
MRTMKYLTAALLLLLISTTSIGQYNRKPSAYGPVSEGYFSGADSVRLFYRRVGNGKDVVVFMHGGPGLGIGDGGYDMEILARGRTLLMYDQRGSGRSEVVTDPRLLTVDYQVRDLEAFRQHFKLKKMAIVGLSWGTGLAVLYASAHPERVERLLLVSPMPPAKVPFWEQRITQINALIGPIGVARQNEIRQLLPRANDKDAIELCRESFNISSKPYLLNPALFTTERSDEICDAPAAALRNRWVIVLAVFESLGNWDFRPMLRKILVPSLVIEGEQTNVPLDATRAWTAALPNSKVELIPNAGHVHFIEQPQAFRKIATRFLDGKN